MLLNITLAVRRFASLSRPAARWGVSSTANWLTAAIFQLPLGVNFGGSLAAAVFKTLYHGLDARN